MTTRITLIKNYRKKETLRLMDAQDVATLIQQETYQEQVSNFRKLYPLMGRTSVDQTGTLAGNTNWADDLPRLCFALEQEHRKQERVTLGYTGLVLLEVNNLTGRDEAEAVRKGAAEMPQTLMTFVGAEGQSVKIVCRGELFPSDAAKKGLKEQPTLPTEADEVTLFHENLYERARLIYNGQLGVTVEKLEPLPERICYISADAGLWYNPMATPIYARTERPTEQLVQQPSRIEQTRGQLGIDRYMSMHTAFEFNKSRAFDDAEGIEDDDEWRHAALERLADYCLETGIPQSVAVRLTLMSSPLRGDELLVEKTFENAYRRSSARKYQERKGLTLTRNVPPETLMTMKVNLFLNANYELRKNVMRGVAEFRQRTGIGFSFQDLTEEARNSITMRALEVGIRCWDKDIRRYVNSDDIERYDPVNDYLEHLPRWDGRDRVAALAARVPTDYEAWPRLLHIWLRSMVAMWLGKGQLTGNALVPLLIGRQGCGKSSFCRILMPRELQDYYNDRINFKNEQDLNLGLTSFALINLDEFDKITERQQIVLKYLVSTADLKYRPPYGKAYTVNRRYASFIGTTNEQTPLTDPTGSRRFICVGITGDIDFETPMQHDQLFAQLSQEIANGERYWLTKDEEHKLMEHNLVYQRISGLGEMLMSLVQKPAANDDDARWMSLKDLSALLRRHFKGYKEEPGTFVKIGSLLNRPEYKFDNKHTKSGTMYRVKLRI